MRNFSFWKISSGGKNQPELIWQEIFQQIEDGQYNRAEALFVQLQEENPGSERLDLKLVYSAALQICRACVQMKAEAERYRNACQEVLTREHELQQELQGFARQLMQWDLTPSSIETDASAQNGKTFEQPGQENHSLSPGLFKRMYGLLKTKNRQPRVSQYPEPQPGLPPPPLIEPPVENIPPAMGHNLHPPIPSPESSLLPKMPYLVVYFLGPFQVFQGEEAIVEWDSLKSKAIFKYLLAHRGTPVKKDILMEVFWPEATPESAPRNLHQAIYSLRQTLRGKQPAFQHIRFENECYFFNPTLEVWLDIEEFEKHVQAAQSLEAAGKLPEAIEHYTAAESLYQGDFLDEDLYDDWPKARRTHLQSTYLEIANRLTCYYLQMGMHPPAVALCRKVIAMDACNEEAHRQLICCYLAQGQRHLALRQFLMCLTALKEELNLAPSPETQALYQRIIT
ncbi:MAG: winged helix-turn-helix domain-containing protein [Anaerolineales bacterium]|jgi:DNA-binding SARP family transcriptional activator|nr:winged helix-turn-helix domain-containing protein [Anaerolineales bacterium]